MSSQPTSLLREQVGLWLECEKNKEQVARYEEHMEVVMHQTNYFTRLLGEQVGEEEDKNEGWRRIYSMPIKSPMTPYTLVKTREEIQMSSNLSN